MNNSHPTLFSALPHSFPNSLSPLQFILLSTASPSLSLPIPPPFPPSTSTLHPLPLSFLSGLLSGAFSRFLLSPLDVIKIRLQVTPYPLTLCPSPLLSPYQFNGFLDTLRRMVRNEGVFSLWKGNLAGEILAISYSSLAFPIYYLTKIHLSNDSFICGGVVGVVVSGLTYPFDLMRTRMAVQQDRNKVYKGLLEGIKVIYRSEGMGGFYIGLNATLVGIMPMLAIQFGVYDFTKNTLKTLGKSDKYSIFHHFSVDFISGFVSGIISKLATLPFDVAKKRLQVRDFPYDGFKQHFSESGVIGCIKGIYEKEGIRGIYKGGVPSILKAGPNAAFIFTFYNFFYKQLEKLNYYNKK